MGRRRNRDFWLGVMAALEESSLTRAAFAAQRGLNIHTMKWWMWKLRRERRERRERCDPRNLKTSGFVEVASSALPVVGTEKRVSGRVASDTTLRVGSGVVVGFSGLPPAEYVAAVARSYDGVTS